MSEATRAVALAEASKLNLITAEEVLAVAAKYDAFLSDEEVAKPAKPSTGGKPATGGKKPGKSEDEVVKEALEAQRAEADAADEAEEGTGGLPATEKGVQAGVAKLLKANKRKEAIALLKSFGASSASGVKAKDYAKFVAKVTELLSDGGGEDDLTA